MGLFPDEHYAQTISKLFSIMHRINNNPAVSRIENIDESMKEAFLSMGYNLNAGEPEYVYLREELVTLKGNPFKSKRAMYNYFVKNYTYSFVEFQSAHVEECMRLFERWKKDRGRKPNDDLFLYQALLEDASYSHKQAITNYESLSLTGRVVQIDERIEGYTFGFRRGDVFYILMEITNPEIKGLSQFIFRELCRELSDYTFINTLGDSGLTNLRNAKLSYRPYKVVPGYIAYPFS
ncbi:MAG: DUF2156 domain-containing protein [Nitrospirae bacterium]|nr:DUF2156 domain-containing protein [Nitrospirota bacterium]